MNIQLLIQQIVKHKIRIALSLIYLISLPFLFDWFQKYYYCGNIDDPKVCKVWGSFWGVVFIQIALGSAFIGYIGAFINQQRLSRLHQLFSIIVIFLYIVGLYFLFHSYSKITSTKFFYGNQEIDLVNIKSLEVVTNPMLEGGTNYSYYLILNDGTKLADAIDEEGLNFISRLRNIPITYSKSGYQK